jgi:hypothetical protein
VLGVEPTGEGLSTLIAACGADSDKAREIIAGKLAQLAARNGEIGDFGGPVSSEADKSLPEHEPRAAPE